MIDPSQGKRKYSIQTKFIVGTTDSPEGASSNRKGYSPFNKLKIE